ncbi:MAG: cobalamin-independent methionine synthase II family protein [Chloroflexi bacterium]|nr:cobalamin-independent methionine synthase II family protein [Chloroflexota bacterium]
MKRSAERYLTTHVGSLIRPPQVVELTAARASGQPLDATTVKATLASAVGEVVDKQVQVGLDVVSDGEFGKLGWYTYIYDRLEGYERRPADPPRLGAGGEDRVRFREYYATIAMPQPQPGTYRQEVCVGPIKYVGQQDMQRDVDDLVAALSAANHPVEDAFLPVIAPASISSNHRNEYYTSEEAYLFALADALGEEYRIIVEAGLLLQIDDSILANGRDYVIEVLGQDYRKWVEMYIEATNHALRGIPQEKVRYHLCWGSWPGPHTSDGRLDEIIDLVLQIDAQGFSLEAANPRHEWEWVVWQQTRLPEGKILIPGVISHAAAHVEHPELVAQRITRFADLVGRENVIASTDCGFAQSFRTTRQHPSIQWAKLEALVEGARLASG